MDVHFEFDLGIMCSMGQGKSKRMAREHDAEVRESLWEYPSDPQDYGMFRVYQLPSPTYGKFRTGHNGMVLFHACVPKSKAIDFLMGNDAITLHPDSNGIYS